MKPSEFLERATREASIKAPYCAGLAACAVKHADEWYVVDGIATFTTETATRSEDHLVVNLPELRVWQQVVRSGELAGFMEQLARGLVCGPVDTGLARLNKPDGTPFPWDDHFEAKLRSQGSSGFPERLLESRGGPVSEIWPRERSLDQEARLPGLSPAFADWAHASVVAGLELKEAHRRNRSFRLLVLTPVRLAEVALSVESSSLHIVVEGAPDAVERPTVVAIATGENAPPHQRVEVEQWKKVDEQRFTCDFNFSGYTGRIYVAVLVDGVKVDERVVGLPIAGPILHLAFDPEFGVLDGFLQPKKLRNAAAGSFETGVCWLLAICGLAPVQYGRKELQRAPDLVALLERRLIVGECSIEVPDADKLRRLATRAEELRSRLQDGIGAPFLLTRAMFIPTPTAQVSREVLHDASEAKVSLVSADHLAELRNKALIGASPEECWLYIVGLESNGGTGAIHF